ncbi:quinolinate synthase NadA [Desulfohalovibrio reitneri]|uniref:quinolinate synthase NadA n=1 Tax=Desulfohalovibrio reitneri TaxID=1307759 RepID=UPI00068BD70F|nr:quinolinate synthase NadA [Desulfohalovibrio reitneri]
MQTTSYDRIRQAKDRLGDSLAIFAHHYQAENVVRHADIVGDSLELARKVPGLCAEYIVFCGVYFMAETASILARPGQHVQIPERDARCIMAAMAPVDRLRAVMRRLDSMGRKVVPLTYVNSTAGVKAMVGEAGGTVCTSANARTMLQWALDRGDSCLFIPDKNLALNTADQLGIPEAERHILDIRSEGEALDLEAAARAKLLIWPGCCAIHHRFKPSMIEAARAEHPGCLVVVHPECPPETVALADESGSTSTIIRYCEEAPEGATIIVGTEINLVERLARRHAPGKTVLPLSHSGCLNMGKVTEDKLADTLENIGYLNTVQVADDVSEPAALALQRMLEASA